MTSSFNRLRSFAPIRRPCLATIFASREADNSSLIDDVGQQPILAADRRQDECTNLVRQFLAVATEWRHETTRRELHGRRGRRRCSSSAARKFLERARKVFGEAEECQIAEEHWDRDSQANVGSRRSGEGRNPLCFCVAETNVDPGFRRNDSRKVVTRNVSRSRSGVSVESQSASHACESARAVRHAVERREVEQRRIGELRWHHVRDRPEDRLDAARILLAPTRRASP